MPKCSISGSFRQGTAASSTRCEAAGRIKGQIDEAILHAGDGLDALCDLGHDLAGDRAPDGRQRHDDMHVVAFDAKFIDQTQIHDIHRNFRVVYVTKHLINLLFVDGGGFVSHSCSSYLLCAQVMRAP
jgi:hypothetical protein